MRSIWVILIAATLILAWLTIASTAIRVVSRIWMRDWVERGGRSAHAFRSYLERPQRLLASASAGAGLVLLATGATLDARFNTVARDYVIAMLVAIVVLALFGQSLPRALARHWPTRLAPPLVWLLGGLSAVLDPIASLGRKVLPAAWRRPPNDDTFEELLREGLLEGVGSREEIATIAMIVQFAEKTVGQVMTQRFEVFAVEESMPRDQMAIRISHSKYTRVPVYRGSLDQIVGMLHAFDLLKGSAALDELPLRPIIHVPVDMMCNELLFRMLRASRQLAIVQDSAGKTVGLVTLEDLLEELVGDIRDEHDEPATAA
ncbi:MAG TPA: CBS domain-containing protein [Gemmatimonadales bacterium]|nr:CBS domain-containing protein [Gemmatimonadales bacterium]